MIAISPTGLQRLAAIGPYLAGHVFLARHHVVEDAAGVDPGRELGTNPQKEPP